MVRKIGLSFNPDFRVAMDLIIASGYSPQFSPAGRPTCDATFFSTRS